MKCAIVAFLACLTLSGCHRDQQAIVEQLRPGQTLQITNSPGFTNFDIYADFPVDVTEADCVWHRVTNAHFTCPHASDLIIRDTRLPLLPGKQNFVQVRY
jgi:hypothetical protein